MLKNTIVIISAALILAGCATRYQPESFTGGFTETQYSPNVWNITFNGNGFTKSTSADDMALLRSAELTLINGFKYFAIVDRNATTNITSVPQASRSSTRGNIDSFGNFNSRTTTYGGAPIVFRKPSSNNTIIMFKENENEDPFYYDASFICDSIGPRYKVNCAHEIK